MTNVSEGASMDDQVRARAQGCLLGQLAGDSLGGLVEFRSRADICAAHPRGVRLLAAGGTHGTLVGQPTDDSEMALALARSIVRTGRFDPDDVAVAYARWLESGPFDFGRATNAALRPAVAALGSGRSPAEVAALARASALQDTQANGALMRVSPLGIFAHALPASAAADLARQDARLTHPHEVCRDASAALVVAIAHAVATGSDPAETHAFTMDWVATSADAPIAGPVRECLEAAVSRPPGDYEESRGWVLIALGNAFWQLLHARSLEDALSDTILAGGDTDTNAAICGALLGAVHGVEAIPDQWREAILSCEPEAGRPGVRRPRPREYWPSDALEVAAELVRVGREWA